ncbi:MAG: DinB family protein [Pirellulaceae bacterium]
MTTTVSKFSPPASEAYAEYYQNYVGLVPEGDFLKVFEGQIGLLDELLGDLPAGEDSKLHEPYTWTLKQLMGHLIDVERIFSTRMLRIGVGDPAPLPGMDQDLYVANLDYEQVSMADLLGEFSGLRRANVLLAKRMSAENLALYGVASDQPVSAKANLFILAGHVEYHVQIIRKRLA